MKRKAVHLSTQFLTSVQEMDASAESGLTKKEEKAKLATKGVELPENKSSTSPQGLTKSLQLHVLQMHMAQIAGLALTRPMRSCTCKHPPPADVCPMSRLTNQGIRLMTRGDTLLVGAWLEAKKRRVRRRLHVDLFVGQSIQWTHDPRLAWIVRGDDPLELSPEDCIKFSGTIVHLPTLTDLPIKVRIDEPEDRKGEVIQLDTFVLTHREERPKQQAALSPAEAPVNTEPTSAASTETPALLTESTDGEGSTESAAAPSEDGSTESIGAPPEEEVPPQ